MQLLTLYYFIVVFWPIFNFLTKAPKIQERLDKTEDIVSTLWKNLSLAIAQRKTGKSSKMFGNVPT
jgi:VanZ family protein